MKVWILAIFVAILGAALAVPGGKSLRSGRPGCTTEVEMRVVYYRNLYDPTAFWRCDSRNTAAALDRCEEGAFQDKLKKCVSWDEWEWEDPQAPPSRAD